MEVQEIADRLREEQRSVTDMIQATISDVEKKLKSEREALQRELDDFKYDLKNEGLIDIDA